MLKCPNCGTDNMLTAIFCRGCGQKIDLNAVKPDDFAKVEKKKGPDTFMQNLIGGIIIGVLLIGFLVGLFFPSCGKIGTTEESRQAALKKFEGIGMDKGAAPVEVTDEDISNFVTAKLLEKKDSLTGNPRPTGATVHCLADGKVKIIATGKYCGLPISLTVEGTVSLNDRRISVRGEKCSVGLFPLPQGLEQSFLGPFRTNFNNVLDDINGFRKLETAEGKATLVRAKVRKQSGMPGDMMMPPGM